MTGARPLRMGEPKYLAEAAVIDWSTLHPMNEHLDAYLRTLGGGLEAFPDALMKGSLVRSALSSRPLPESVTLDLPPRLAETLLHPPPPNTWIPVTLVVGTLLTIADHYELDDRTFLAWRREQYRELLGGPLYRVLFAVVSPEKLVAGAAHKWRSLTRNSLVLERVETSRGAAEIIVSWPTNLLPTLIARSLMEGVRAALELSGAKRTTLELHDLTPTGAHYRLRWG